MGSYLRFARPWDASPSTPLGFFVVARGALGLYLRVAGPWDVSPPTPLGFFVGARDALGLYLRVTGPWDAYHYNSRVFRWARDAFGKRHTPVCDLGLLGSRMHNKNTFKVFR